MIDAPGWPLTEVNAAGNRVLQRTDEPMGCAPVSNGKVAFARQPAGVEFRPINPRRLPGRTGMRVLFVSSEAYPLAKTGGLGRDRQ
jgi:hypothetical protein